MDLSTYKENSINAMKSLNEAIDVANTDEIIGSIVEQKMIASLAYQIAEVSPVHGPTAANFALVFQDNKVKLLRGEIGIVNNDPEDTGLTLEAVQDLINQFGKDAYQYIGNIFGGISAENENTSLLSLMDSSATAGTNITLSDPKNAETILFEAQQEIAESVIKINSKYYRSLDGFAVVPLKVAGAVIASPNIYVDSENTAGLYLGKNNKIKYYLNPDITSNTCYVGINSTLKGNSSIIMSPYQHTVITASDYETSNVKVFNVNRYAMTYSEMASIDPMLYKFEIN